ncbi:hypothetical protein ACNOIU_10675 [Exiguobacterium mexicanum]|uniref:SMODS-associated NUDIX domain-containing protein n=1 Tax=Exiguobacterium mexicanum TaxID=340146 RepID=A0ABT7MLX5_9BACL|nr:MULTISPECIES: hypothetical protein [Exiguobacterium]MDL5375617.1 hypothetical protein [Exiguobacterium mexicanum]
MNISSLFRKNKQLIYWFAFTIILAISFFLISKYHTIIIDNWYNTILSIIGTLGALVTAKDISTKFKKTLYKIKTTMMNKQVSWSLFCNYKGETINNLTFNSIKNKLKEIGDNNRVIHENSWKISLTIDGVLLECSYREHLNTDIYSSNEYLGEISLYIPEYHAPYLEASDLLEERIFPILNYMHKEIGNCHESFSFDVIFKDYHPYLGLYVKDFRKKEHFTFTCDFSEESPIKGLDSIGKVTITHKKLTLRAKSLNSFSGLIKKHLFLAGG